MALELSWSLSDALSRKWLARRQRKKALHNCQFPNALFDNRTYVRTRRLPLPYTEADLLTHGLSDSPVQELHWRAELAALPSVLMYFPP